MAYILLIFFFFSPGRQQSKQAFLETDVSHAKMLPTMQVSQPTPSTYQSQSSELRIQEFRANSLGQSSATETLAPAQVPMIGAESDTVPEQANKESCVAAAQR